MANMDLADMIADVRYVLGGYTSNEISDALATRWLRWAQLHVSRPAVYMHRELLTSGTIALVLNDRDYPASGWATTTDNVQAAKLVVNESRGQRLRPLSLRQIEESARPGGTLLSGRPTHYALEGDTLYVYPAPNSTHVGDTVRVWYWRKPTALAASPASELAEEWDEVIVAGAVWRGWRYLNVSDRAEIAKAEFGQLINEVADRMREDMREDMADRHFDVEVVDFQDPSF